MTLPPNTIRFLASVGYRAEPIHTRDGQVFPAGTYELVATDGRERVTAFDGALIDEATQFPEATP